MHLPLTVTAHMATGIAHSLPWGISLDGILAAEIWASLPHGPAALDVDDPPDLDLPLTRCVPDHGPWHWAATCAWPDPIPDHPDVHTWIGRVDHRALEHLTSSLPKVISDRQGRYRARCMPLLVTTCLTLTWTAIGDPDAIRALLEGIPAIGKKRSQGEGRVLAWQVTPTPDLDRFAAAHLTPLGTLGRPSPAACLMHSPDVIDGGRGLTAVRPPAMHPSRLHDLHLPAPWAAQ